MWPGLFAMSIEGGLGPPYAITPRGTPSTAEPQFQGCCSWQKERCFAGVRSVPSLKPWPGLGRAIAEVERKQPEGAQASAAHAGSDAAVRVEPHVACYPQPVGVCGEVPLWLARGQELTHRAGGMWEP